MCQNLSSYLHLIISTVNPNQRKNNVNLLKYQNQSQKKYRNFWLVIIAFLQCKATSNTFYNFFLNLKDEFDFIIFTARNITKYTKCEVKFTIVKKQFNRIFILKKKCSTLILR